MIVVDSSVWIDFFRGNRTVEVDRLFGLLDQDAGVALTDVVLTELLQGTADERAAQRLDGRLAVLTVLRLDTLDDFRRAASLYREARRAGFTIRKTVDCLIASVCVREQAQILHSDSDFDRLAACTELQVVDASG